MVLGGLFDSIPPSHPYEHKRSSDAHRTRNNLLKVLAAFVLWWAGNLYADYRSQGALQRKLEIQVVELEKDVEAVRKTIDNNATLSTAERADLRNRMDRIESKMDNLGEKLLGAQWLRPRRGSRAVEPSPYSGGGPSNGGGAP